MVGEVDEARGLEAVQHGLRRLLLLGGSATEEGGEVDELYMMSVSRHCI